MQHYLPPIGELVVFDVEGGRTMATPRQGCQRVSCK